MTNFKTEFDRLKELVDSSLIEFLPFSEEMKNQTKLFDAMSYTLKAPGKRIRPVLLLLSCNAVNGNENDALPYACAIEYIHNYSLIHDDLPAMDDDDFRRGIPTNHKVFGEAMAILAGDGLLSAASEVMHEDYLKYIDDAEAIKNRLHAGMAITSGCGISGMVAGQAADVENENESVSAETLDYIHKNKTAALIRAAIEAGAWIGGANSETVEAFSEYGANLGLAFQIADDLLDLETEEGKATYPAVHGQIVSKDRLKELSEKAVLSIKNIQGTNQQYIEFLVEMAGLLEKRTQ